MRLNQKKALKLVGPDRMETQRRQLISALQQTGGNRTETARILGVSRVTVWNRMKRFGIRLSPRS